MNKAEIFWDWFMNNNKSYFFLDEIGEPAKNKLLDELLGKLHLCSDNLFFEIGGEPNNASELIITTGGGKEYFRGAENLVEEAPPIDGWKIVALKPAVGGHFESEWDGIQLNTEDLWFMPYFTDGAFELGITIFIPDYDLYSENEALIPLVETKLATILGEKSFGLDIDYVDVEPLPDEPQDDGLRPIIDLPNYISYTKQNRS